MRMTGVAIIAVAWVLPAAWATGLLERRYEPRMVRPDLAASWEALGRKVYIRRVSVGTAHRYVALGGILPSGIRLDPASGELRGTPARVADRSADPSLGQAPGTSRD